MIDIAGSSGCNGASACSRSTKSSKSEVVGTRKRDIKEKAAVLRAD